MALASDPMRKRSETRASSALAVPAPICNGRPTRPACAEQAPLEVSSPHPADSRETFNAAGTELLRGAVDSHVHCCPHINRRTITLFDAVRHAATVGMAGLGLMDVFANTSGYAAIARRELIHLGVDVFGGIILEPYVGGLSARAVSTALGMGYGEGGARFVSLPCHHTAFVARSENRSPAYIETTLEVPERRPLPDPLGEIIDLCVAADVVFNLGHLSGREMVTVAEAAAARGCTRMLAPAAYLAPEEAAALVAVGAALEYSFFVLSHATDVPQTMIDAEKHRFLRADLATILSVIAKTPADRIVLSSDSGAFVLPLPVEALREMVVLMIGCGVPEADVRTMITTTPSQLFKIDPDRRG